MRPTYYSFSLTKYILFSHELTASPLSGVVVLFSGLVFIGSYLYLSRKGN